MNLQSEITYFSEMGLADKARLMASFLSELTTEARATYGAALDTVHDGARLRFTNEMCARVTKLIEQYLGDDKARPADDDPDSSTGTKKNGLSGPPSDCRTVCTSVFTVDDSVTLKSSLKRHRLRATSSVTTTWPSLRSSVTP